MKMMMMMMENNSDHYLTWASPQVKRGHKLAVKKSDIIYRDR